MINIWNVLRTVGWIILISWVYSIIVSIAEKTGLTKRLKNYFLMRKIEQIDSCCGDLSSTYGYPDEAFNIRMILYKIRNKNE
jgi:hypothetical protein